MPGLREALEGKFDELDQDEIAEPVAIEAAPEPAEEAAEVEETDDRERDESGRFAKGKPASDKLAAASAPTGPAQAQGVAAAVPAPVATPAFKPPQSWRAPIREHWGSLPPDVQAEIDRREKEIGKALQESAEKAKGASGWTEAIRPYEAQIRASGGNPQQYVGQLLQASHTLSYGHPQQKAGLVADLCLQFGVSPQDLDGALVQRLGGGQQQQQRPQAQQFSDPRVDKLLSVLEQQKHEHEQVLASEAEEVVSAFADREFFSDVALDFANLIDVMGAQGKKQLTQDELERAFNTACQLNPDVSQVLGKRKAVSSIGTVQAATQRARAASSSVRSQPTAAIAAQPSGRRAALEAAFEALDE